MVSEHYELFDTSSNCSKLLPIHPVMFSVTFYKVNLFRQTIELPAEERWLQARDLRLGLLPGFLNPLVARTDGLREIRSGDFSIVYSSSGAFLPAALEKSNSLLTFRQVKTVSVDSPTKIKAGQFSLENDTVEASAGAVRELAEQGEAWVRSVTSGGPLRVVVKAELIELSDVTSVLRDRQVTYGRPDRQLTLSDENLNTLLTSGSILIQTGRTYVRIQVREEAIRAVPRTLAVSGSRFASTSSLATSIEVDSAGNIKLSTFPVFPQLLSAEDYCLMLGILMSDPRHEPTYDYKKKSNSPPAGSLSVVEYRDVMQRYAQDLRYEICLIQRDGIQRLYNQFGVLDHLTLAAVPRDSGMLDDDLFCAVVAALKTNFEFRRRLEQFQLNNYISTGGAYDSIFAIYLRDPRLLTCSDGGGSSGGSTNGGTTGIPDATVAKPEVTLYEIGLVTGFQMDWELLGYSRGALLSSITLAPREEVQVEVFTWDRFKLEEEKTFGYQYETNREINVLGRASAQIVHDIKKNLSASAGVDGGVSIPIEDYVNINLGGSGDISNQVEDGVRSTVERLNEVTRRAAEQFKATHQVKIVQTHEVGEERRTIRRLRNANSSRTLSLHHFEILENYRVTTRVRRSKQYGLLVETPPLGEFDIDIVRAHEHLLQRVLLSPNYRDGFKAAQVLAGYRWFESSSSNQLPQSALAPPAGSGSTPPSTGAQTKGGIFATAKSLQEIIAVFLELDVQTAFTDMWTHLNPAQNTPITLTKLRRSEETLRLLSFWEKIKSIYPGFDRKAQTYVQAIGPLLAAGTESEIIRQVSLLVDGFDDDLFFNLKMLAATIITYTIIGQAINLILVPVHMIAPFTAICYPFIFDLVVRHDDNGLPAAVGKAKRQLNAAEARLEVETLTDGVGASTAATETVSVPLSLPIPQVYSLPELAQAQADFEKLRLHLEAHRLYYQNEIWRAEDPSQRFQRLNCLGLTPFVENRLLGFAGSKAIFPLRFGSLPATVRETIDAKFANFDLARIEPEIDIITLPTPGVHTEAVLGQCESLEPYLQDRRAIDLQLRRAATAKSEQLAQQTGYEAQRLKMRLEQDPPLLDSPFGAQNTSDVIAVDEGTDDGNVVMPP
jgi:hypothetical protein